MKNENLKIKNLQKEFKEGDTTCLELTERLLKKIKEKDGEIKAFLEVTEEMAVDQAEKIDKEGGFEGLKGIPVMIKDNILVEDVKATAASKMLEDYTAPYDATVVEKLKEAGVVILGKGNLDEFAMGGSTENSAFFPTKNPVDTEKVPGGSSGGPAAAVAAGMVSASLGTDTGGSVRQPASFCGVVGFKPSYGKVSRYGVIAMASSLDQVGPIANSVEDVTKIFNVIKGKDEKDATSVSRKSDFSKKEIKVGIPKEYFVEGVNQKVKETVEKAIGKIDSAGMKTVKISLPHTEYALACYQVIMASESSTNLARYDGIRYCSKNDQGKSGKMKDAYIKNRSDFGDETKRRIMLGTFALSSGYYDDYYMQAEKVRELIREDFRKAFEDLDIIITPTSPIPPFGIGEKIDDPLSIYLADMFTVPANLAGLPAISIPCPTDGLPVGIQLMGERFEDEKLLGIAEKIEKIIVK